MKKIVILCLFFLNCCGLGNETNNGFLFYANIDNTIQVQNIWTINTFDNNLSIDDMTALEIEKLDLINYPCVDSEEDKDYLFTLITYTEWKYDSIANVDDMTQHQDNWFWWTKKTIMQNSTIHTLGKIKFCDDFESYLFAKHSFDDRYNSIQLYAVNVFNECVVSIVQLNSLLRSVHIDSNTDVIYQPHKKKCILYTTRYCHDNEEDYITNESTMFFFSPEGRIQWKGFDRKNR